MRKVVLLALLLAACSEQPESEEHQLKAKLPLKAAIAGGFKIAGQVCGSDWQIISGGTACPDPFDMACAPASSPPAAWNAYPAGCALTSFTSAACSVLTGIPAGTVMRCKVGAPGLFAAPTSCDPGQTKRNDSASPRGYRCDCPSGQKWSDAGTDIWQQGMRCDWGQSPFGGCKCVTGVATTATPAPARTAVPVTPPGGCPAGTHAVTTCEPDVVSVPTKTPPPGKTPVPGPTDSAKLINGGWNLGACTKNGARTGLWPASFAISASGMDWSISHDGQWCSPDGMWLDFSPNWDWTHAQVDAMINNEMDHINNIKAKIKEARDNHWPRCTMEKTTQCDPGPLRAFIYEVSTFAWGVNQDVWFGGFFKTDKNGKKVSKTGAELGETLAEPTLYAISRLKALGFEEFLISTYQFGWANGWTDTSLKGLNDYGDGRRDSHPPIAPPKGEMVAKGSGADTKATVEKNHPEIWPANYNWKGRAAVTAKGFNDKVDAAALKRDEFYYLMYIWALKAQHPEITRVVPQLSNCVLQLVASDAWINMGSRLPAYNKMVGYPPDVQIELCNKSVNPTALWDAPTADCASLKQIKRSRDPIISGWDGVRMLPTVEPELKKCP